MTSFEDGEKTILRNMLLGRWAADKLGIAGGAADAYSNALAAGTHDPERRDVFKKVRKDFDAAGVVYSDEEILRVMTELMLKAGNLMPTMRKDSADAAGVVLARKLMSR
jgi:hypothetical protein